MDLERCQEKLRLRQIALNEGLHQMKIHRAELVRNIEKANIWGSVNIVADVILLPLNIILNSISPTNPAYLIKDAMNLYDKIKAASKGSFDVSGWEVASNSIDLLTEYVENELSKSGAKSKIPGLRILAGLSQDTISLMEKVVAFDEGGREQTQLLKMFDRQLQETIQKIEQTGIKRALLHELIDERNRTA